MDFLVGFAAGALLASLVEAKIIQAMTKRQKELEKALTAMTVAATKKDKG